MRAIVLALTVIFIGGCSDTGGTKTVSLTIGPEDFPPELRKQFDTDSLVGKVEGNKPLTKIELVNVSRLAEKVTADKVVIDEKGKEITATEGDVTRDFTYHVMFVQDAEEGRQLVRLQDAKDGWPWYIMAKQIVYVSTSGGL